MAQDKTNVVIIQVQRSGGFDTSGGDGRMFRLGRGDYDETIAALRAGRLALRLWTAFRTLWTPPTPTRAKGNISLCTVDV